MPYSYRLQTLRESHRLIDSTITNLVNTPGHDEFKVKELKKQKLIYKDEIRKLERAQWEHDHETVDFGDE